jgi:NAD(P)-dependent dehydrogenase (short-subunit alcohol dehydrogenase family)
MKQSKFSLSGKYVLITGAAGLLGIQHAEALLEVEASVILTDVNHNQLNQAGKHLQAKHNSSKIICTSMDVTSRDSILQVQEELSDRGLRVDVLVNNAAIDPKVNSEKILETSRLENIDLSDWNKQIDVGLTGAFLCCQTFGSAMAKDCHGGVILNIASDLSVFSPDQRIYRKDNLPEDLQPVKPVTYSVIKHGLIGLTKYVATYWSTAGVRCNALSPGGIYTNQSDDFVQKLTNLIPLGRMAYQDEYKSAIQFLCSDASAYMNGQNIIMDGGRSAW